LELGRGEKQRLRDTIEIQICSKLDERWKVEQFKFAKKTVEGSVAS